MSDNKVSLNSVYEATYDMEIQCVHIRDTVSDVYSTMSHHEFNSYTNNFFGRSRADKIMVALRSGLPLTISWAKKLAGFKPIDTDKAHQLIARAMSPDAIENAVTNNSSSQDKEYYNRMLETLNDE